MQLVTCHSHCVSRHAPVKPSVGVLLLTLKVCQLKLGLEELLLRQWCSKCGQPGGGIGIERIIKKTTNRLTNNTI